MKPAPPVTKTHLVYSSVKLGFPVLYGDDEVEGDDMLLAYEIKEWFNLSRMISCRCRE